ncbi:MAG: rhomboid family intramembrane serine protease [Armatimonadetes bacterium]|nr:rhomboid family intramembrane serine protease [Armatimonadota bacterium]
MWFLYLLFILILLPLLAPPIPLRKREKSGWDGLPFVTIGLILVNIFAFLLTVDNNNFSLSEATVSQSIADKFGIVPRSPSLLTLFTHLFLHGSWSHLFFNMLFLLLFAPHIEDALGRWEYLLFYIGGGFVAGLLHVAFSLTPLLDAVADKPLVGASGAIAAVLGLFAVRFWRAKLRIFLVFSVPAMYVIGFYTAHQIYLGLQSFTDAGSSDSVANWAHVGGLLFGALIAIPLRVKNDSRQEYTLEDAEAASKTDRWLDAATLYDRYLAEKPGDAATHHLAGRVRVKLRQSEAAHQHFTESLRLYVLAPPNPANAAAIASVFTDACAAFAAFPLPATLLSRVAGACEETGQYGFAERALSDLCRDHAETKEAENGLFRLGKLYLGRLNNPEKAAKVFIDFLMRYPESEWRVHAERLHTDAEGKIS